MRDSNKSRTGPVHCLEEHYSMYAEGHELSPSHSNPM